ncbi:MAG: site-2 protease family protein [Clostridiales bacterium]|nr:site-2 protease family protein [Clostridiales bacterium]
MLIDILTADIDIKEKIFYALIMIFALTLSFSIHEFMHAFTADWLGDPTPRSMGRLTLNPIAHMDPMGTVLLLVAGFGWGKPVMYNPRKLNRFKSYRGMNIMVHLAGVTGNFVLALICSVINVFIVQFADVNQPAIMALTLAFSYTSIFSLMLLAFNLLPIPPLDGFHVLEELMPIKLKYSEGYRKFQKFAPLILLIVFVTGSRLPFLGSAIEVIKFPFAWVINAICNGLVQLLSNFG